MVTARERALAKRRPQLLDDRARMETAGRDGTREDAWVKNFISRLAGALRDIGNARRKVR
jgi:hypothetical protein